MPDLQAIFADLIHPDSLVGRALPSLILLVAGLLLIVVARHYIRRFWNITDGHLPLNPASRKTIERLLVSLLWLFLALVLLRFWGIDVSSIWSTIVSLLAVVGVGLLATWTMVSNITARLFVLIWRPYHLGQQIEILPENLKGRVIDTDLMFTCIEQDDGQEVIIPNNLFFQRIIRRAPMRGRAGKP